MHRRVLDPASVAACTLGDPALDRLLRGGVPCGAITEIVGASLRPMVITSFAVPAVRDACLGTCAGEASTGKTQTCMQLLMTAQWPAADGGLDGDALYICTEGDPPTARLHEMAARRRPGSADPQAGVLLKSGVVTGQELLAALEQTEAQVLRNPHRRRIRLIVIDSIANVFRDIGADGGGASVYAERAGQLFRIASQLKRIADQYQLAVVTVNQVSDVMTGRDGVVIATPIHTGGLRLVTSGREVQPALGLAWANCVNHRVFLSRAAHPFVVADASAPSQLHTQVLRTMQVVYSCSMPQSACCFVVEGRGLRSLTADEVEHGIALATERATADYADAGGNQQLH